MRVQVFGIAGIALGVSSDTLTAPEEKWQRFLLKQTQPELLYRVRYQKMLPAPTEEPIYRDPHIRFYQTDRGVLRIYSDFCTAEDTAAVLELNTSEGPIEQEVSILAERYPWGTKAGQLLKLYQLPHYLLRFGKLLMHCAYVLYNGEAVIFTAPSGTGKTTQAELWRSCFGAAVVNGDRAALSLCEGRVVAHGLPVSGSSDDCENVCAPVRAIVSLAQAEENRLQCLSGKEALKHFMRGIYLPPEDQADFPLLLDTAASFLRHVPFYHLECLPDVAAARLLRDNL